MSKPIRKHLMAVSVLAMGTLPAWADDETTTEKPVIHEDGGKTTVTVTKTDTDGDGNPNKIVTTVVSINAARQKTKEVEATDTDGDGKAEKQIYKEYSDPAHGTPSRTVEHSRNSDDPGWRRSKETTDADQDGTPEETKEASSLRGNGNYEEETTTRDTDDDGTADEEERRLADPGGDRYRQRQTRKLPDGEFQLEEGDFGPVRKEQDSPNLPTGQKTGALDLDGNGTMLANAAANSLQIQAIATFLSTAADGPTLGDPALLATFELPPFVGTGDGLFINGADSPFSLRIADQVFMTGVIHELLLSTIAGPESLDPAADMALTGAVDLDTLRLAAVPGSPFFDPLLTDLESPFILHVNALFDPASSAYLPHHELLFRFDLYDTLPIMDGQLAAGGVFSGLAGLEARAIPAPPMIWIVAWGALIWLAGGLWKGKPDIAMDA